MEDQEGAHCNFVSSCVLKVVAVDDAFATPLSSFEKNCCCYHNAWEEEVEVASRSIQMVGLPIASHAGEVSLHSSIAAHEASH